MTIDPISPTFAPKSSWNLWPIINDAIKNIKEYTTAQGISLFASGIQNNIPKTNSNKESEPNPIFLLTFSKTSPPFIKLRIRNAEFTMKQSLFNSPFQNISIYY